MVTSGLQPFAEMRCLFPQRFASALPPFEGITSPLRSALSPLWRGGLGGCSSAFGYRVSGIKINNWQLICHSERSEESLFCHFWLDPKVTKKSRLRALHTPSRRLHAWKSGNSLRFGQPDFLSPCSLFRRLTARGPRDGRRGRSRRDSSLRSEWQTRLFALICTRLRNSRSDTV